METTKRIIKDRRPYAVRRLAEKLGVSESALRGWLRSGSRPHNPLIRSVYIKATAAVCA